MALSAGVETIETSGDFRGAVLSSGNGDAGETPLAYHIPVMANEVVRGLAVREGGVYLDGTLGEGGHSAAILEAGSFLSNQEAAQDSSEPGSGLSGVAGLVIGIDLDPRSLEGASRRLSGFGSRFLPVQGNYADMASLAGRHGVRLVDGVLLDLGFSSRQVDRPGYGLSFLSDEPLDMRYDPGAGVTAASLVNSASEDELAELFRRYGEEPRARAIARGIARGRAERPISTTGELASLVERATGGRRHHRLHPATRVFQALRIAVNGELENLQAGLSAAVAMLRPGGFLAVISYHSLEDRIVKNFMAHQSAVCVCPPGLPQCICGQVPTLAIVNRRIIRPSGEEVAFNPRSRSARLRLARRIQSTHELE